MADDSTTSREQAVQQLYLLNFSFIRELIHSDPRITIDAENQILEGVAKHLADYHQPLTEAAFQSWVTEIVVPLVGFHAIRRVCRPFVLKAIWSTLGHTTAPSLYDDYPETVQEIEQEVWLWVFLNQSKLQKNRRAKMSTRVYARAQIMTQDWMKRQKTRRFAVIRKIYDLPNKKQVLEDWANKADRENSDQAKAKAEQQEIQDEMKNLALMA